MSSGGKLNIYCLPHQCGGKVGYFSRANKVYTQQKLSQEECGQKIRCEKMFLKINAWQKLFLTSTLFSKSTQWRHKWNIARCSIKVDMGGVVRKSNAFLSFSLCINPNDFVAQNKWRSQSTHLAFPARSLEVIIVIVNENGSVIIEFILLQFFRCCFWQRA